MVPLNDENPTSKTAFVVYGLIVANVLLFLYEISLSDIQLRQFFYSWAVVPCQLSNTCSVPLPTSQFPEWVTLFSSQFLHGGWLHLGGNMLFLWIFGNNVEDCLGHVKFLIFYLACGVLASLSQWFFSSGSAIPTLGASGAIAGVMGAYILRFPKAKVLTLLPIGFFITTVRIPAFFFLGFWFLQQAFYGVASLNAPANIGMEAGGIAYWAHAGGFVFGAILGPLLGLFSSPE
ncbi:MULTISPECIES: rhomboid family intramembrane serine protease [Okeania]|uniref:Rhomboid family intramembrane serine protease n=1 Tax=Okeania hirsuta TaxID=1458930 RepID=A0A3N6PCK4_9CYAN|nr:MULTISPECIES: rhomboid family intramembrane serine protease [Okeania]NET13454.1 rhomboid family intramembrane serine protease [Okeania sp. SIO1H6]NES77443.1 rhomboid family intramembrane serine protease [Okeania sp. SIO1H4]NES88754.1 rhomboid family intramembrane serine protease [Okeania sp. SIO2B9]NET20949.1 rhomboid family intramembrane serine protease [Okeania sp. SIO1H5]NET77784.1 rhomboid family intramembrane serine protease [Okeania sp. SIO1F9]